jgi:hypothetical protein
MNKLEIIIGGKGEVKDEEIERKLCFRRIEVKKRGTHNRGVYIGFVLLCFAYI